MDTFPVTHDVEYELTRLMRRSRLRGMHAVEEIHPELDYASYLLMIALYETRDPERGGVRGSELAETAGVHKSTVSRGLTALEGLGLVERVPDSSDGRARLVTLSSEAVSRYEAVRARRLKDLAQALADWAPQDLAAFADLLQRLNGALD